MLMQKTAQFFFIGRSQFIKEMVENYWENVLWNKMRIEGAGCRYSRGSLASFVTLLLLTVQFYNVALKLKKRGGGF